MEIAKHMNDRCYCLDLSGKFTFEDNRAFREILSELRQSEIEQIVFNMQWLEFVDSAGLGMLLLAQDEAFKHNKQPIILRNATGQVRKMITIARFENYFVLQ